MPTGYLRVNGTLDLTQFWPGAESDADTAKVKVTSVEFSPDPAAHKPFQKITILNKAFVRGQGKPKAVINKGQVTIRFQGIDATELHFAAMLPKKGLKNNGTQYRQHFGETAPVKLHQFLSGLQNKSILPCQVVSFVDHPNDIFDMYGRMIGDILVTAGGKQVNANQWLVENGWAFPTYYNSMSPKEITTIDALANTARKAKSGIWKYYSNDVGTPDTSLTFEKKGTFNARQDAGPEVMPKIFRRQIRYFVSKENGLASSSFRDFLVTQKDGWVKTADFLKNPKIKASSKSLAAAVSAQGKFGVLPGDIVFFESPSTLVDANGKKITDWS
ncbi:MAG TPA: thermonuclease family protein [Terriglobales bacterium]|nr:thermonuclease family protein [Terriglobales bacterium]